MCGALQEHCSDFTVVKGSPTIASIKRMQKPTSVASNALASSCASITVLMARSVNCASIFKPSIYLQGTVREARHTLTGQMDKVRAMRRKRPVEVSSRA